MTHPTGRANQPSSMSGQVASNARLCYSLGYGFASERGYGLLSEPSGPNRSMLSSQLSIHIPAASARRTSSVVWFGFTGKPITGGACSQWYCQRYRHSQRGNHRRTATPTGRAQKPSAVSVQVTQATREPFLRLTRVVIAASMCSVTECTVNIWLQLVAVTNAEIYLRRFKALVSQPCLNSADVDAVLMPTCRACLA